MHLAFLKSKRGAYEAIVVCIAKGERQLGVKVLQLHADPGREFSSNKLRDYCTQNGIEHVFIPPWSAHKLEESNAFTSPF